MSTNNNSRDEVNEVLPAGRMFTLGLQHVLVMYAGAITVPLIVGGALGLPQDHIALLITADLLCCGIVSFLQAFGIGRWLGIRLPVMMGISYAGIAPMIAIGLNPEMGLPGLYGAIIGAGIIGVLIVPLVIRLLWLFPPIVTGTTLTSLGVSLFGVAIVWAGGGYGVEDFGSFKYIGTAGFVLLITLLVARFFKGFMGSIAILVGLAAGMLLAMAMGNVSFQGLNDMPWVQMVRPFQFGFPVFEWSSILTMTLVVIITMIESIGLFYSLAIITNRKLEKEDFARGLRTDAMGAVIGGIFNTFPYTSYAQNIGLVGITGVRSRFVCVVAAAILVALALFPKMAHIVAAIPHYVLGGAALIMFGMVAASGIRILQAVDFKNNRHNMFILAISLGVGLIPMVSPKFFGAAPEYLTPLLNSGVLLSVISAVILNLYFNGSNKEGISVTDNPELLEEQPHLESVRG